MIVDKSTAKKKKLKKMISHLFQKRHSTNEKSGAEEVTSKHQLWQKPPSNTETRAVTRTRSKTTTAQRDQFLKSKLKQGKQYMKTPNAKSLLNTQHASSSNNYKRKF